MRSMEHWANGLSDLGPGIGIKAGFVRLWLILNCWQVAQPFM